MQTTYKKGLLRIKRLQFLFRREGERCTWVKAHSYSIRFILQQWNPDLVNLSLNFITVSNVVYLFTKVVNNAKIRVSWNRSFTMDENLKMADSTLKLTFKFFCVILRSCNETFNIFSVNYQWRSLTCSLKTSLSSLRARNQS